MRRQRICAGALALVLGVFCLSAPAMALGPDPEKTYRGIDVSVYQGDIDFQQVRESGVEVVYIRAGEGSGYTDPYFAANAEKAGQAGLRYGFYLYVTARSEAEARTQAAFFAGLIQEKEYHCRPAMDFEDFSGLSVREVNAIGLAFLEELEERTGVTPVLYSDAYAADHVWGSALGAYPLWAADYGPSEPDITSGHWAGWAGFQYADDGQVPGIRGRVDLDHFTGAIFVEKDGGDPESTPEETYTVRRGDTLWAIARRYDTTVAVLAQANGLSDPARMYPGQVLRIPYGGEDPEPAPEETYTVRHGDTLWAIARRYGTTVAALAQVNGLSDPARIYPGQVLRIP